MVAVGSGRSRTAAGLRADHGHERTAGTVNTQQWQRSVWR